MSPSKLFLIKIIAYHHVPAIYIFAPKQCHCPATAFTPGMMDAAAALFVVLRNVVCAYMCYAVERTVLILKYFGKALLRYVRHFFFKTCICKRRTWEQLSVRKQIRFRYTGCAWIIFLSLFQIGNIFSARPFMKGIISVELHTQRKAVIFVHWD